MALFQHVIHAVSSAAFSQSIGWLLVHSLWQFTLVSLLAAIVTRVMRRHSSASRYWIFVAALSLMVVFPIATWYLTPVEHDRLSVADVPTYSSLSDAEIEDRTPPGDAGRVPPVEAGPDDSRVVMSHDMPQPVVDVQSQEPEVPSANFYASKIDATLSPWLPALVAVWCCGVLLFSIRPVWSWLMVRRLLRQGTLPVIDNVQLALRGMCDRMQVKRRVEVLASTLVGSPIVVGCFRSVILLPISLISSLPGSQLEAILAHELAHVRRYDYLVNLLQTLAETLFFYHPAVWWLSSRIRTERENCCDDLVVAVLGNKVEYGRALLAVDEYRGAARTLAVGVRDASLLIRVRRLLAPPIRDEQRSSAGLAALAIVATGLTIAVLWWSTLAMAENDKELGAGDTPVSLTAAPADAEGAAGPLGQVQPDAPFRLPDHWIVEDLRWTHDDKELITVSLQGGVNVRRWDVIARTLLSEIKLQSDQHGRPIQQGTLRLSADGRRVIGVTDAYVGVWDSATGHLLRQLPIPQKEWSYDTVRCLDCSPDGSVIAAGLETRYDRTTLVYPTFGVVWNAESGEVLSTFEQPAGYELNDIVVLANGQRFVTCSRGHQVAMWESKTGKLLKDYSSYAQDWTSPDPELITNNLIGGMDVSSDGKLLAIVGTFGIRLIDVASDTLLRTIDEPYSFGSADVAFSVDGTELAWFGAQRRRGEADTIIVRSTATGEQLKQLVTPAAQARFSGSGQQLAVGDSDFYEAISVWPLVGPDELGPLPAPEPYQRIDRVEENTHSRGPHAEEFAKRWDLQWGESRLGLQYGIALTTKANEFSIGQRVPMVVFLRNASDKAIQLDFRPDMFGNPPQISGNKGVPVELSQLKLLGANSHYRDTLEPNELFGPLYLNVGLGENPLPNRQVWTPFWSAPERGEFQVNHRATIHLADPATKSSVGQNADWQPVELTTGNLRFSVMQQVVSTLYGPRINTEDESGVDSPAAATQNAANTDDPEPSATASNSSSPIPLHGKVIDESGEAVPRASFRVGLYLTDTMTAESDLDGQFSFSVPAKTSYLQLTVQDRDRRRMFADTIYLMRNNDGTIYLMRNEDESRPGIDEPLTVKLVPVIESQVTIVDGRDQPVRDATVVVQNALTEVNVLTTDAAGHAAVRLPQGGQPMIMAFKSGVGYDYFSASVRDANNYPVENPPPLPDRLTLKLNGAKTVRVKAVDSSGRPVTGATIRPWYIRREGNPGDTNFASGAFNRSTDADGLAVFDWIPPDVHYGLTFWPHADGYDADRLDIQWQEFDVAKTYETVLKRMPLLSGRVVNKQGRPVAGAAVKAHGRGVNHGGSDVTTTTDATGRFSVQAPPDRVYVLHVQHDEQVGYVDSIVLREGSPIDDIQIKLLKGTIIRGQVTRGTPPRPVANEWISLSLEAKPFRLANDTKSGDANNEYADMTFRDSVFTDADGRFRFLAAPGEYYLSGPQQAKQHKFVVGDEEELEFNFNMPREEMMHFVGNVQGPDGERVANVDIYGVYEGWTHARHSFSGKTGDDGGFSVERETQPAMVQYLSADKSLGAIRSVDGEQSAGHATLRATYTAKGRLLNPDGTSYAGAKIQYSVKVYQGERGKGPWTPSFGGSTTTDAEGNYTLEHLIQEIEYDVTLTTSDDGRRTNITRVRSDQPGTVELGENRLSDQSGPQSLKDRVAAAFSNKTPLAERLAALKHEAARDFTRIAVVVAAPDSKHAEWFYRLLRGTGEDREGLKVSDENLRAIRSGMNDFRQIWVDAAQFDELRKLLADHELDDDHASALILLDTDGSWLCHFEPDLEKRSDRALKNLQNAIEAQQLPDRDAVEVLTAAKAQAAREGKRIFLQETATWCGPCHILSRFIEQHRAIFDKHFVWIKIDRERMTGGEELMQPIRPGSSRSIPWVAILDAEGVVLGTSTTMSDDLRLRLLSTTAQLATAQKSLGADHPQVKVLQRKLDLLNEEFEDDNYGFPTEPKEVERFLEMLTKASSTLSADEIATLKAGLLTPQKAKPSDADQTKTKATNEGARAIPIRDVNRQFADGDEVKVTQFTRLPSDQGSQFEVRGTWQLASRESAVLEQWCAGGEVRGEKKLTINKGTGEFRFQFSIVSPGQLHLSLYPTEDGDNFGSLYYEPVDEKSQIVDHTDAEYVSGVVVDEEGKPISGCNVEHPGHPGPQTDDQGRFQYKQSSPERTVLRVYHPEYRLWHGAPHLGDVLRIVLQKKPKVEAADGQRQMTVRVIDSRTAEPVAHVKVTAVRHEGPGDKTTAATATTHEDGTAVLKGLEFIRHELQLSADRPVPYIPKRSNPEGDEHEVVMLVDRACQLTLRAVDDETGKGIAGVTFLRERALAEYWAESIRPDILGESHVEHHEETDADGYFRCLVGPETWSYMVGRFPDGYDSIVPIDRSQEVEIKTPVGGKVEYTFRLLKTNQLLKE